MPDNLWRDLDPVEWLMTKFVENVWMNPAVWLVSRELTELAGPWDVSTAPDDDGEYISRVMTAVEKIKFVPESRCYYRKSNPKSLSKDLSVKALEGIFRSTSLCIGYLRSLEDSERTRSACLTFLQNTLIYFYPDHPAILKKANDLAEELGGELAPPVLRWKHSMLKGVLGWRLAKKVQPVMPLLRTMIVYNWDELLYNLSKSVHRIQ
jgi:hypothetical protein